MTGKVKIFYDKRGWGFIETETRLIFVHYTEIKTKKKHKTLHPGQKVEFDLYLDPKDPNAYIAKNVIPQSE